MTDEEHANLSAAFSRLLGIADTTKKARALRRAADALANLVTQNLFMEQETDTDPDLDSAAKTHHTFTAGKGSSWNKAVRGVVESVNTMSKCATGMCESLLSLSFPFYIIIIVSYHILSMQSTLCKLNSALTT